MIYYDNFKMSKTFTSVFNIRLLQKLEFIKIIISFNKSRSFRSKSNLLKLNFSQNKL